MSESINQLVENTISRIFPNSDINYASKPYEHNIAMIGFGSEAHSKPVNEYEIIPMLFSATGDESEAESIRDMSTHLKHMNEPSIVYVRHASTQTQRDFKNNENQQSTMVRIVLGYRI